MLGTVFCVILFYGLGIVILACVIKDLTTNDGIATKLILCLVSLCFFAVGTVIPLMQLDILSGPRGTFIGLTVFCIAIGTLFLMGAVINLMSCFAVNTKINATLVDIEQHGSGSKAVCSLIFQFHFKGRDYQSKTDADISPLKAKRMKIGQEYSIYIADKDPRTIALSKWPSGITWLMIVVALAIYLIPIEYITGFFQS